jgi:arabinan endo-1,5-alpha-L-arabinosidase
MGAHLALREEIMIRTVLWLGLWLAAAAAQAQQVQPTLSGDIRIHDPSVIVVGGTWVAFETGHEGRDGGAVRIKTSPDGVAWTNAGSVGKGIPRWVRAELGFQPRNLWAPTISKHGDTYYLYYSASTFGVNTSAIGLTINSSFDPAKPEECWEDQGLVIRTDRGNNYNAIDPFRIDTPDGRAWLPFGSFWSGIKMIEIDPVSGKRLEGDDTIHPLASRGGAGIEAPAILEHDGYYYLFVSFDRCCAGIQSTYRILVGRAGTITGPYVDADGRPMMAGGGTEVQSTTGRFIGPGGQETFTGPEAEMLAYHYYDGDNVGVPKLQISPIRWSADGWPVLDPPPQ